MQSQSPTIRDNFGLTAEERYGAGSAYGFVIVSECGGRIQQGQTYYARREDAEADAAWQPSEGVTYRVEQVVTAACSLRHSSRIPEFEKAAAEQRRHRAEQAEISRLVGKGFSYWDALMLAKHGAGRLAA
ncbi:hypothetical protein [Croceibacterium aestuarii]|uniref:hypothetical protein n=1 Tax=Croceibacterium aestuarii TaxID=3064139 RepID=UPI00272E70E9|nr:hypothetical protein [Croceibacterium sp. D39]